MIQLTGRLPDYLPRCSRSTVISASEFIKSEEPNVDYQHLVHDEAKECAKHIIVQVNCVWPFIQSGCMGEVLKTLRLYTIISFPWQVVFTFGLNLTELVWLVLIQLSKFKDTWVEVKWKIHVFMAKYKHCQWLKNSKHLNFSICIPYFGMRKLEHSHT